MTAETMTEWCQILLLERPAEAGLAHGSVETLQARGQIDYHSEDLDHSAVVLFRGRRGALGASQRVCPEGSDPIDWEAPMPHTPWPVTLLL